MMAGVHLSGIIGGILLLGVDPAQPLKGYMNCEPNVPMATHCYGGIQNGLLGPRI